MQYKSNYWQNKINQKLNSQAKAYVNKLNINILKNNFETFSSKKNFDSIDYHSSLLHLKYLCDFFTKGFNNLFVLYPVKSISNFTQNNDNFNLDSLLKEFSDLANIINEMLKHQDKRIKDYSLPLANLLIMNKIPFNHDELTELSAIDINYKKFLNSFQEQLKSFLNDPKLKKQCQKNVENEILIFLNINTTTVEQRQKIDDIITKQFDNYLEIKNKIGVPENFNLILRNFGVVSAITTILSIIGYIFLVKSSPLTTLGFSSVVIASSIIAHATPNPDELKYLYLAVTLLPLLTLMSLIHIEPGSLSSLSSELEKLKPKSIKPNNLELAVWGIGLILYSFYYSLKLPNMIGTGLLISQFSLNQYFKDQYYNILDSKEYIKDFELELAKELYQITRTHINKAPNGINRPINFGDIGIATYNR